MTVRSAKKARLLVAGDQESRQPGTVIHGTVIQKSVSLVRACPRIAGTVDQFVLGQVTEQYWL